MVIVFERLVGRNVARFVSSELDLAGVKMSPNNFLMIALVGGMAIFVLTAFTLLLGLDLNPGYAMLAGIGMGVIYEVILYAYLEFRIDGRREFVENVLSDYLQLTAANMR